MIRLCLTLVLSLSVLGNAHSATNDDPAEDHDLHVEDRFLSILDVLWGVPCMSDPGPLYNFQLNFDLVPQEGWDLRQCSKWRKRMLGKSINRFLEEYGIGPSGDGDDVAYIAEVCNRPKKIPKNRRGHRELGYVNFRYYGGGMCRWCSDDDGDRRLGQYDPRTDPNWFQNTYKPEMQNLLRNEFKNIVARNHVECLSPGPQVTVEIIQVEKVPHYNCESSTN